MTACPENPESAEYRDNMPWTYLTRGLARRALGDAVGVAVDVRLVLGARNERPHRNGDAASCCFYASKRGRR